MKSADRLAQVLTLFTEISPYHSVGTVSEATGLATSSAHALITGLVEAGILQRHGRRRFCLGPVVIQLADVVGKVPPLRAFASQALAELARKTQDRVMLLVRRENHLTEEICHRASFPLAVEGVYLDAVNRNLDSKLHEMFYDRLYTSDIVIDEISVRGIVCVAQRLKLAATLEPAAVAIAIPECRHLTMQRAYTALLTNCVREIETAVTNWRGLLPVTRETARIAIAETPGQQISKYN
ncbi:MAG: hypothetical protein MnENMB40S_28790 [Rhizobiaceae bacterium MnEN-MB40S]|nr:MAG: hypothetical protein MnENMB40S_28790 [Rhizobiaceae bacterium MnEN-MB40S]